MTYAHDPATVSRRVDQASSGRTQFVAIGAQTRGDYGLFEYTMPAGGDGPGPHFHRTFSESFYVLDGQLSVLSDDRWLLASAGDLVYVPRSGIHGFRSVGESIGARFLILFTPGAPREQYFHELVALHADGHEPSIEEIDELAARHDQTNLRA